MVFSKKWQKKGEIKFPKLTYEHYKAMQSYKVAGRVEMFNGVQDLLEEIASTDVCSLYPYVMGIRDVYYPCGEIVPVTEYQGDEEIGFYYCDIDQSILKSKNLPNIYPRKAKDENQWDYEGNLEDYFISNVMIRLLKKYGCTVVVKNGITFSEKKKSCQMFSFIPDFMKAKNAQDDLKANDDPSYNPALRDTLKLLMNAPSGKVIEGLHLEKTEAVESYNDYKEIFLKAEKVNVINAIGSKVFVTYSKNEEEVCKKSQKPIYLGVLIYDYSKEYMFENSYSKIGKDKLLYTDTDASKFRKTDFNEWRKYAENTIVPHWPELEKIDARYKTHTIYNPTSKVFGSFEDEMSGFKGDSFRFMCVEKKAWMYESYLDEKVEKSKFCFKGVNGRSQILTLKEDFVSCKETMHKDGTRTKKYSINDDKLAHIYCAENVGTRIENGNVAKFFSQLKEKGDAYLLCSSFRKVVKNGKKCSGIGDLEKYNENNNTIQICYQIKHIDISESKKLAGKKKKDADNTKYEGKRYEMFAEMQSVKEEKEKKEKKPRKTKAKASPVVEKECVEEEANEEEILEPIVNDISNQDILYVASLIRSFTSDEEKEYRCKLHPSLGEDELQQKAIFGW